MTFLLLILIAHFLGDFVLQPNSWVNSKFDKGLKSSGFWKHIAVHTLLLIGIGLILQAHYLPLAILLLSHILIDALKVILAKYFKSEKQHQQNEIYLFLADQFLHLLAILIIAFQLNLHFEWTSLLRTDHLLVVLGYVFISLPSSSILRILLSPYTKEVELKPLNESAQKSLKNGGMYIGIIERFLVFTFIMIGQWSAVGFLITAKSVFRFGDLNQGKNRQFTEYVLIGTLLSFGFAIFTALFIQYLLVH